MGREAPPQDRREEVMSCGESPGCTCILQNVGDGDFGKVAVLPGVDEDANVRENCEG